MKKFIYIALLTLVTCLSVTSCTEEQIEPTSEEFNGGGGASESGN